jgi:hypothetical protein
MAFFLIEIFHTLQLLDNFHVNACEKLLDPTLGVVFLYNYYIIKYYGSR